MAVSLWQGIFYTIVGIIGFTANGVVSLVLLRTAQLRRRVSAKFVINQSIIDCLASVAIATSHRNIVKNFGYVLPDLKDGYVIDELICRIWNTNMLMWALIKASTVNLVILTVERYIKIVHYFFYQKHFSQLKIKVALAFPWVFCFAYQFGWLYDFNDFGPNGCDNGKWPSKLIGMIFGIGEFLLYFFIPILIMLFCYTRITVAISRQHKTVQKYSTDVDKESKDNSDVASIRTVSESLKQGSSTENLQLSNDVKTQYQQQSKDLGINGNPNPGANLGGIQEDTASNGTNGNVRKLQVIGGQRKKAKTTRIQRKVIKTLIMVCVVYFLCYVWNQVIFFLANIEVLDFNAVVFTPFYTFSIVMTFINALVNPFIYALQFMEFKSVAIFGLCPCLQKTQ